MSNPTSTKENAMHLLILGLVAGLIGGAVLTLAAGLAERLTAATAGSRRPGVR